MTSEKCSCPPIANFREHLQMIDAAIDTMDESLRKIMNSTATSLDYSAVYHQLKSLEVYFGQMFEMASSCENTQKIVKHSAKKLETMPLYTMVQVTPTDFLKAMKTKFPAYFDWLAVRYAQNWEDISLLSEE